MDSVNGMVGSVTVQAGSNLTIDDSAPGQIIINATDNDSGGDVTGVIAGLGLRGGAEAGDATLNLGVGVGLVAASDLVEIATGYRLPQACSSGQLASWDGTRWICANSESRVYAAGSGLDLNGRTFDVRFSGSGSEDSAARSDHDHLGQIWNGEHPLVINGVFASGGSGPSGAALMLDNGADTGSGLMVSARGAAMVVPTGRYGLFVNDVSDDGVHVAAANGDGVRVAAADQNGVSIGSAGHGVVVGSADGFGMIVNEAGSYGGWFRGSSGGILAQSSSDSGRDLVLAGSNGVLSSDPNATGSDVIINANQTILLRLGRDGTSNGKFEVRNRNNEAVFTVGDNGNATLAGALTENSDRNAKQDLRPLDGSEILGSLADLPLYRWAYRDDPDSEHVGPMAQDFYAAFGLGSSDTSISTIDRDGVALAAIQELHRLVRDQEARLAALEAEVVGPAAVTRRRYSKRRRDRRGNHPAPVFPIRFQAPWTTRPRPGFIATACGLRVLAGLQGSVGSELPAIGASRVSTRLTASSVATTSRRPSSAGRARVIEGWRRQPPSWRHCRRPSREKPSTTERKRHISKGL